MGAQDRRDILAEAEGYVTKDRNSSYGEPEDNFKAIAAIWTAQGVTVDGRALQPHDVALMMAGMKLARLRHDPTNRDSWADTIGYMACGWDCAHGSYSREVTDVAPSIQRINDVGDTFVTAMQKVNENLAADHASGTLTDPEFSAYGHGWVSHNRCGKSDGIDDGKIGPNPHEAHSYSGGAHWCDGFISSPVAQHR